MERVLTAGVLGLLLLTSPVETRADVTITEENENLNTGETTTTRIFVGRDRVRVETGAGGEVFMFRGDREVFWMVDYGERTYMEMTAEDMERMGGQISQAASQIEQMREQMQAQLEGLPEAQRRMIEQAMAGQFPQGGPGPGAVAVETEYRLIRSGEQVGDWSADLYEGTRSGAKVWDIWVVDWSEADLSTGDFAAFERLAQMMERMASQVQGFEDFIQIPGSDDGPGYPGIPVRRVSFRNGEAQARYEITDIDRETIDPSMFELPEGFSRQSMPGF